MTSALFTIQLSVVVQLLSHFDSLQPHGLQHARLPCPSLSFRVCSNSCPLTWWCHPVISSSVIPSSSCLHSFPGSGSFPVSPLFASGGHSIEASASALFLTYENMWGRISFFHYISSNPDSASSKTWSPVSCSLLLTFTLQGLVRIKWNNAWRTESVLINVSRHYC